MTVRGIVRSPVGRCVQSPNTERTFHVEPCCCGRVRTHVKNPASCRFSTRCPHRIHNLTLSYPQERHMVVPLVMHRAAVSRLMNHTNGIRPGAPMIEVADLAPPVQQAVREGLDIDALRLEGVVRLTAALSSSQVQEYTHAMTMIAIAMSFFTAAARLEEPEAA